MFHMLHDFFDTSSRKLKTLTCAKLTLFVSTLLCVHLTQVHPEISIEELRTLLVRSSTYSLDSYLLLFCTWRAARFVTHGSFFTTTNSNGYAAAGIHPANS